MSVKSSSCHPKCCMMTVKSIPGTFNFLSSKFFGERQSQSVHVWMLFYVSSVLSVWVSADLLSSGPCSLSVSLSLCLHAHSGLICLHKICLCWPVCIAIAHSIHPSTPTPLFPLTACTHSPGFRGQLKETLENMSLSRSALLSHFLHDCSALFVYVKVTQ